MNIWVIKDGLKLVYRSYLDLPIKEDLVSGLLTALNEFVRSEFNQPIDSINMGGLMWVYDHVEEHRLLFVAADTRNTKVDTLRSRLEFIKQMFMKQYLEHQEWREWNGDTSLFKPFEETIDVYYANWQAAENLNTYAESFDYIRVFQEIFGLIRNVIDAQIDFRKKAKIIEQLEDLFKNFKKRMDITKIKEMDKVSYSKDGGFNVFDINPTNCDIVVVRKQLKNLLVQIVKIIKDQLGHDLSLNYFSDQKVFAYIFNNNVLLKKLDLESFLLQLFLLA